MKTNRMRHRCETRRGFTLLEVLIVLAIIGVIAAMVVPNLLGQQKEANKKITKNNIKSFQSALDLYAVANEALFPEGSQQDALSMLMLTEDEEGNPVEPLLEAIPRDAWGTPLFYEHPNTKFNTSKPAVWSAGPNKRDEQGGGDDITSWERLEKDQLY